MAVAKTLVFAAIAWMGQQDRLSQRQMRVPYRHGGINWNWGFPIM
jgi:hypothetical protein